MRFRLKVFMGTPDIASGMLHCSKLDYFVFFAAIAFLSIAVAS